MQLHGRDALRADKEQVYGERPGPVSEVGRLHHGSGADTEPAPAIPTPIGHRPVRGGALDAARAAIRATRAIRPPRLGKPPLCRRVVGKTPRRPHKARAFRQILPCFFPDHPDASYYSTAPGLSTRAGSPGRPKPAAQTGGTTRSKSLWALSCVIPSGKNLHVLESPARLPFHQNSRESPVWKAGRCFSHPAWFDKQGRTRKSCCTASIP